MAGPRRGSCLCGDVAYTVAGALGPVTACHCGQCRKSSGHFTAAVPARWADVTVTGEAAWYRSSAAAQRGFCSRCGSSLFWEEFDGLVYLLAGCLDDTVGLKMDGHIFYADKGAYYDVATPLPCWARGRNGPEVTS